MIQLAVKNQLDEHEKEINDVKQTVTDMAKQADSKRNLQLITENKRLREENIETKEELTSEKRKYNHKTKLIIKPNIPTVWFIGFMLSLLWYLYSTDVINFKTGKGINIIYYIVFWTFPMVVGLNRASIIKFGITLLKVLARKDLSNQDRIILLKEVIQQWIGVYADLSHVVALENKKDKKIKDIINE